MHRTNHRWRIGTTPCRLWQRVGFLCVFSQEMLDGTGDFSQLARHLKQVHFVVSFADFVRNATRPCLDLGEAKLFLIVPCLADIYFLVWGKPTGSALRKSRDEHDEAAVDNLFYAVVAILPCLDHFLLVEMLLESMHRLFWTIVPACVDPDLSGRILPNPIELGNNGFGQVIVVTNVYPVAFVAVSPRLGEVMWAARYLPTRHTSPL